VEIIGFFPFMLSLVEAFIGFFSRIKICTIRDLNFGILLTKPARTLK